MSDARPTDSQPTDTRPSDARTQRLHGRAVAVRAGIVLATFAVVGAIAGVVWEWVWTPPVGIVFQGEWILEPSGPDYDFSGTGWYVVIALAAGLLTAAVLGWVLVAGELTTLASAVVGSVLAGWLMFTVGHTLGPPDPRPLAAAMDDLERLPSDLRVAGDDPEQSAYSLAGSAFLAFPLGTVLGLSLVWFTTNGRRVRTVDPTSAG